MEKWNISEASEWVKEKLQNSGLFELSEGCFAVVDQTRISAMVERWHPETNTFHLPFGEMTITLVDVAQILGIPVKGHPIHADMSSFTVAAAKDLLVRGLGISNDEASAALNGKTTVKMSTIREWCERYQKEEKTELVDENSNERADCAVRGYLLYVLGCTAFRDKSGTRVSIIYLKQLMDVKEIHSYSWGNVVLAFLYRQLGLASRANCYSMTGCFTLLQVWIHEHLKFGNYISNQNYDESQPRTLKWEARQCTGPKYSLVLELREQLDNIMET